MNELLNQQDIRISADDSSLTLECAGLIRKLDLTSGAPRTISLRLDNGGEMIDSEKTGQDFYFIGLSLSSSETPFQITDIKAAWHEASILSGEHASVILSIIDKRCDTEFQRTYILFPGIPAIGVQTAIKTPVLPNIYWSHRRGLQNFNEISKSESCQDMLRLSFKPCNVKAVEFIARTDYTDELVKEHKGTGLLNGNILYAESTDGSGILYLQEAMPSEERRDFEMHDFRVTDSEVASCGWGIPPEELSQNDFQVSCRHVLFAYTEAKAVPALLKKYLKARFPITPEQSGQVVVNPWGCGQFPRLVSEDFLKKDIAASAKAGADYYQIDDTWQKGDTLGALTLHNEHIRPSFWEVSPKLNGTFATLVETAKNAGVKLGLWLAPSSNCEYRDWRETVEIIHGMYRKYGFDLFKIDGVRTRTYEAEENLRKLLETARLESDGKIYFNLDTTNGQRPGYFMFLEYGNIFLENRYVCHKWGQGYHPEKTLRSLWRLSKYMRPQMLQIEIPDPNDINAEFYASKRKPQDYSIEYWGAISLFACPLLWFTPSRSTEDILAGVKNMTSLHTKLWREIFDCEIYPIGDEPSGKAITGFQAHNHSTGHGFLLFFREVDSNCVQADVDLYCPITKSKFFTNLLTNNITAPTLLNANTVRPTMPDKAMFALWRY